MTTLIASQLRTLAFGDVDGGLWGVALTAAEPVIIVGDATGAATEIALPADGWRADEDGWRLSGEGIDLQAVTGGPVAPPPPAADDAGALRGVQDLCHVQGSVTLGGATRRVDCVGTRCAIDGVDATSLGSVRVVSGWFADDEAFVLLSLRSGASSGQESDLVAATLFDPEGPVPVTDPRLSTTYTGEGHPVRATLELWVGTGDSEFPRRAAGEAARPGTTYERDGATVHAVPLRCHSRGREGTGVYVLASFS